MADDLPLIKRPELVFGFVAPIGTDVDGPVALFRKYFEQRDYKVQPIKVTSVFPLLKPFIKPKLPLTTSPLYSRYKTHIAYGNQLRELFKDNAFLAKTSISRIIYNRNRTIPALDSPLCLAIQFIYYINSNGRKRSIFSDQSTGACSFKYRFTLAVAPELTILLAALPTALTPATLIRFAPKLKTSFSRTSTKSVRTMGKALGIFSTMRIS